MHEYLGYIRQIPKGQAGKLHLGEQENPVTIRRRLVQAAQPRSRRGIAGDFIVPNQSFSVPEEGEQGVTEEESPELGQT